MAKIQRQVGATSQIVELFIQDSTSTTGGGKSGLAFNTASLTCYYKRNTSSASALVSLTSAATLGTYLSGAFQAVDGTNMIGLYEFHVPNVALTSGADNVVFGFQGAAGMAPLFAEIELTGTNNQDGVGGGISDIPSILTVSNKFLFDGSNNVKSTPQTNVTVGTNNDKTGYALTAAEHTNISTDVQTGLLGYNYTSGRGLNLDRLDVSVGSRLSSAAYVSPDNADIATIVATTNKFIFDGSNNVFATVTSGGVTLTAAEHTKVVTDVQTGLLGYNYTSGRALNLDRLDVSVGSRLSSAAYVSPDNADIATIVATTNKFIFDGSNNVFATVTSGGVTLTAAEHTKVVTDVQTGLLGYNYTSGRAVNLDKLDVNVSTRSAPGTAQTVDGTSLLTEAYTPTSGNATLAQVLYEIAQNLGAFAISGTTITVYKKDGTSTAETYTLDSATTPTKRTRTT